MASARQRVRTALIAAASAGTLRLMVDQARRGPAASGRDGRQQRQCEADAAVLQSGRPRWQLVPVVLQIVALLALIVGSVFAAAYALGRCTAAGPWQSDDAGALRRCAAASCLGCLLPLLCAWATADRHCCRRRTPTSAAIHPAAASLAASASPNAEDLLVDYTLHRPRQLLPKQLPPLRLGRAKQQELLPLPTKQDKKPDAGRQMTVSVKALIGMIQAGSMDLHASIRLNPQRNLITRGMSLRVRSCLWLQTQVRPSDEQPELEGEDLIAVPGGWVDLHTFVDMAPLPGSFDSAAEEAERYADLLERFKRELFASVKFDVAVFLHVYDYLGRTFPPMVAVNWLLAHFIGLGLYHSGVEVGGREFSFSAPPADPAATTTSKNTSARTYTPKVAKLQGGVVRVRPVDIVRYLPHAHRMKLSFGTARLSQIERDVLLVDLRLAWPADCNCIGTLHHNMISTGALF